MFEIVDRLKLKVAFLCIAWLKNFYRYPASLVICIFWSTRPTARLWLFYGTLVPKKFLSCLSCAIFKPILLVITVHHCWYAYFDSGGHYPKKKMNENDFLTYTFRVVTTGATGTTAVAPKFFPWLRPWHYTISRYLLSNFTIGLIVTKHLH